MSEASEQRGPAAGVPVDGKLPIGSVEDILAAAPNDLVEEVIEVPEWNCSIRVRSLTAAQAAAIRTIGVNYKGEDANVSWVAMEKEQFLQSVVEPSFSPTQVDQLYATSGRGFNRVLKWVDEKSNLDKEALKSARDEFQESHESN